MGSTFNAMHIFDSVELFERSHIDITHHLLQFRYTVGTIKFHVGSTSVHWVKP